MSEPFWGAATGVGSMPGRSIREAVAVVAGELPWPHLPELPTRGPGADRVGRSGAVLVDLPLETTVDGWRLATRPGRDLRRARSLLAEDLDALEESLAGHAGPLKVQLAGPLTVAAEVAARGAHRVLADSAAVTDIAASLAEGAVGHLADVRRRLPGAVVSLQLDEPALQAVLTGSIPTPSGFGRVRAVPGTEAAALIGVVADAVRAAGCPVLLHCCGPHVPQGLLAGIALDAVSLDVSRPVGGGDDALAAWLDAGRLLLAGVVPTSGPVPDDAAVAAQVRTLAGRLGFGGSAGLRQLVVTPACGLSGSTSDQARTVVTTASRAGERLQVDPDGEGSGR